MHGHEGPFNQLGTQLLQQREQRTYDRLQHMAERERQIQDRLFHFAVFGIPRLLRDQSPTALYLFVLPFWLFMAALFGFDIGHSVSLQNGNATSPNVVHTLYGFGAGCLIGMLVSMLIASYRAVGLNRVVSSFQMIVAVPFVGLACQHYLNPGHSAFRRLGSDVVFYAVLTMLGLFVITLAGDLIRNRRYRTLDTE